MILSWILDNSSSVAESHISCMTASVSVIIHLQEVQKVASNMLSDSILFTNSTQIVYSIQHMDSNLRHLFYLYMNFLINIPF